MASELDSAPLVLIINPNSTRSMTDGLEQLVSDHFKGSKLRIRFDYFTAPDGPSSINDEDDAAESVPHCTKSMDKAFLAKYSGFIVACYSVHPLVDWLEAQAVVAEANTPVWGIFQASVAHSVQILAEHQRYGIVSTGKVWEKLLSDGVAGLPDARARESFAGVETTGLNATELHDAPPELVRKRMMDATKRLVKGRSVGAICLGCAGMAGMDEMVREACLEELGSEGKEVRIVDGTVAAILLLKQYFERR